MNYAVDHRGPSGKWVRAAEVRALPLVYAVVHALRMDGHTVRVSVDGAVDKEITALVNSEPQNRLYIASGTAKGSKTLKTGRPRVGQTPLVIFTLSIVAPNEKEAHAKALEEAAKHLASGSYEQPRMKVSAIDSEIIRSVVHAS